MIMRQEGKCKCNFYLRKASELNFLICSVNSYSIYFFIFDSFNLVCALTQRYMLVYF